MSSKRSSLQWLTTAVLTYMVLAFAWWAFELWRQNDRLLAISAQMLELKYTAAGRQGANMTAIHETAEYQALLKRHQKHQRMILSEGIFFTLCLVFGLWVINRAARRELSLARQRRNFLLSITHELKSPVAAMRLAFQTLSRPGLKPEQVDRLCNNGLRDADRLQTLVEDLLLAARLEDDWRPQPENLDIGSIIQDCISNVQLRFPSAHIEVGIPPNFPHVRADRLGLTSVVQNLLDNALKYSPPGAPVRIRVEPCPGRQLRLTIADEGIGIPDEEKAAVFEKFYRVGNEETRQTTGTGLGLYIVSQITRLHRGIITVRDNLPRGTVFAIEL